MSEHELNRVEVSAQVDDGRLSFDNAAHMLAHIKEEQEKAAPPPKIKPISAKNGYKKTGRRPPARPSKMEAHYERRRKERAKEASTDYEFQGRK